MTGGTPECENRQQEEGGVGTDQTGETNTGDKDHRTNNTVSKKWEHRNS